MEPSIRYVCTLDDVNIAYYAIGEGIPIVWLDLPYSHLLFEWQQDAGDTGLRQSIASQARLIRLDHRGFGLSDRNPAELSLDAFVRDVEAVVDRLALPGFILFALRGPTTPIAVTYAARYPERLTNLVLFNATARAPEALLPQVNDLLKLAAGDWRFASEGVSRMVQGWDDDSASRALAELLRASIDMEGFTRWMHQYVTWDVARLLPAVRTRTLLTNVARNPFHGPEQGRSMAAHMPDARCFISEGATSKEREAETYAAVSEFLGARPGPDRTPYQPTVTTATMVVILFADIVDSTSLTERMGDATFRRRARALDEVLRAIISDAGGAAIDGKLLGDGVLATFPAASQAIDAALRCGTAGGDQSLPLHVGLHAGDVIREQNNVFGGAVNIAARISALSAQGEVLVSDIVRGLARTSAGVAFEDRGEFALKGVAEAQRVYAVRSR